MTKCVLQISYFITARDEEKGLAACGNLRQDGLHADFYKVDITNESTVEDLKNYIQAQYGGLDILVNNAGIYHVCMTTPKLSNVNRLKDGYFGVKGPG